MQYLINYYHTYTVPWKSNTVSWETTKNKFTKINKFMNFKVPTTVKKSLSIIKNILRFNDDIFVCFTDSFRVNNYKSVVVIIIYTYVYTSKPILT